MSGERSIVLPAKAGIEASLPGGGPRKPRCVRGDDKR
jgi:hypothetical protein